MISRRFKRVAGIVGASALLVAGATTAQAVGASDIGDGYFGWHQSEENGDNSFEVRWDGPYFGYNGNAEINNGLVDSGQRPAEQLEAAELDEKEQNSRM